MNKKIEIRMFYIGNAEDTSKEITTVFGTDLTTNVIDRNVLEPVLREQFDKILNTFFNSMEVTDEN